MLIDGLGDGDMSKCRLPVHFVPSRCLLLLWVAALAGIAGSSVVKPAFAQSSLPDPSLTPGAIDPMVTQENIQQTICVPGWTRTVRPPPSYTSALKRAQIRAAGYLDRRLSQYEEDHLIPLALGGAPDDPRNLWPEPRETADGWSADRKDELEVTLAILVCAGRVPLVEAQRAMASDWIAAYRRFIAAID